MTPSKIKPFIFGKISKIHTISLTKFDLDKPETLAAFGNINQETESDWGSDELSTFSSIAEEDKEEEDIFILDQAKECIYFILILFFLDPILI